MQSYLQPAVNEMHGRTKTHCGNCGKALPMPILRALNGFRTLFQPRRGEPKPIAYVAKLDTGQSCVMEFLRCRECGPLPDDWQRRS